MAAVYSEKEGSLQSNNESSSTEYEKAAVQEVSVDPVRNIKTFDAENTIEEMELALSGPILKAQGHAEVVATNAAVPAVKIKIEELDEDECVSVYQEEAKEGLDGRTTKKEDLSERDQIADGDWLFCCEDSSVAFGNKEGYLEQHRKKIHDGPIVCLDTDSQWDNLLVSTDGGQRTFCCAVCGQRCSSSTEFFQHQLAHRNQEIKQEIDAGHHKGMVKPKRFQCKDCGKAFFSIGQCLNHQRSHKQASKSVFHQLAHLKKKSFQCPTCGRCYSRASALDAHRHCHEVKLVKSKSFETTEKPPSLIDEPGQAESSEAKLEQTGDHQQNVYQCICGKSFRTIGGLGTHQRFSRSCSDGKVKVKVKEKIKHQFECSECDKTFASAAALTAHQHWHKRRSVGDGQLCKCTECGKNFTSLSFLSKHQTKFHSKELPAKSFLHQVCQLKKKAFECQECGRRFSRLSALQSHQLYHTDVFHDIAKRGGVKIFQDEEDDYDFGSTVYSQHTEKTVKGSDEVLDVETIDVDYEIVRVTASDYVESNSGQDPNPELVLVCESDQEEKDDISLSLMQTDASTASPVQLSPDDVKIVQIDFEHLNDETLKNDVIMSKSSPQESELYTCPRCDQTFVKALSLHHHMLWQKDCQKFNKEKHEDRVAHKSYQLSDLEKNSIKCEECGVSFSSLSALQSHQQSHRITEKPFACLQCDRSYLTAAGLYNHQKVCCGRKPSVNNVKEEGKTKHFNPTKSLLGPKVHHCKKCGKGFWSLGAFYHHKQYHVQCADVERSTSEPEIGHIRRRKKGRGGRRHGQRKEYSKEKYECEVCGKSYHMLACFLKHKLSHDANGLQRAVKSFDYQLENLKKNSYQCPDCGKGFSRAMALQFHMKCHGYDSGLRVIESAHLPLSPKKLRCPTCNASFTCESLLVDHQKSCSKPNNDAEYPQECETTGIEEQVASSQNAENVVVHSTDSVTEQKTPLATLKYKCRDCNRSFSVIGALNFHKRIHVQGYTTKKLRAEPARQPKVARVKLEPSLPNAPFACPECGRFFSTNSALGTHKRWHKDKKFARFLSRSYKKCSRKSVDGGPYLCNLCGKGFFYLCVLRRHQLHHPRMESQHQEQADRQSKDRFTCPDCPMSFSSGSLLTAHFTDTHGKLDNTDKVQSEISDTVESDPPLQKKCKMITKKGKPKARYKCPYCPKRFLNERGIRAHKWQKHLKVEVQPTASREERVFTCSPCKLLFASEEALHNHKSFCNANKKKLKPSTEEEPIQKIMTKCFYKCHKCAKDFHSEEQLNAHKELAKSRPHTCALCCRGYWTESQLQQHLAWHDEVRRRLPTELRYRLSTSGSKLKALPHKSTSKVNYSVLLSNPEPNFQCQHCEKSFLSPHALQQHQAVHKSEEPFQCSLCPQIFHDIRDLIDHHQECLGDKERKDSKLIPPERDAGNLTCIECGHSFNKEEELHQHYIAHARGEF
ncbi:zinc finger protein 208-like isoform X1 [Triplophysa rosa]|uniref:C2H2-type domain-containing protein n=1 Tax=Triplophysa rosa TaxID=992332 RepID=A0A9W7WQD0_TRIRA|nr:zinc finger protein 208-like isoform X1 [Triplophysa rosa]KAI7806422.1 hypothetical protein IRJ41_005618 [Triplophysa rosa]